MEIRRSYETHFQLKIYECLALFDVQYTIYNIQLNDPVTKLLASSKESEYP